MKIFLISLLMVISINGFAYCSGGSNDPNYQACIQQEEANRIQREMLELQRKQMVEQRAEQMMRASEADIRNSSRW
ncbi:hypothetical protein [Fluoribacter gormanii]|uniref:hypothetical protein n=1 Tax=Fluoribacter gormanii TaxID=464 RepID=UPI0010418D7F|nr:hypothetical protein [Fluoribacter gormanii]